METLSGSLDIFVEAIKAEVKKRLATGQSEKDIHRDILAYAEKMADKAIELGITNQEQAEAMLVDAIRNAPQNVPVFLDDMPLDDGKLF